MNCLIDFIGILGCGNTAPDSGLYINSLPGISLEQIDKLANSEQVTYASVWNDVQLRAASRFKTKVKAAFLKRFTDAVTVSDVSQTYDLGREIDIDNTTSASAQLRGFYIDLEPFNGNILNPKIVRSNLRNINVQSLSFYAIDATAISINIIDAYTNTILDTFPITSPTANSWNAVNVNKSYSCNRLLIAYDATLIESITQAFYSSFVNFEVRGITTASTTDYTITDSDNTFGLTGVFSIGCSFENIICKSKSQFAAAWLYILGEELMIQRLYSSRINWVTNDKDEAKDLKNYFSLQFDDELQSAINGITINMQDECIECADAYQIKEVRL